MPKAFVVAGHSSLLVLLMRTALALSRSSINPQSICGIVERLGRKPVGTHSIHQASHTVPTKSGRNVSYTALEYVEDKEARR